MKRIFHSSNLRFALLVVILVGFWISGKYFDQDIERYKEILWRIPIALQGLAFSLLYSFVTFFVWLAKDVFKILGAVLYGAPLSSLFIWIAEIINATVLFHLGRKLGRDYVEKKTQGRFKGFDNRIGAIGFGDLFVLRAIILVPFRFLDLGFGLTKINFRRYLTAVIWGSPLRIFIIQFTLVILGDSLMKGPQEVVNTLLAYMQSSPAVFLSLFIFSCLYLIATVILIIRLKKIIWG